MPGDPPKYVFAKLRLTKAPPSWVRKPLRQSSPSRSGIFIAAKYPSEIKRFSARILRSGFTSPSENLSSVSYSRAKPGSSEEVAAASTPGRRSEEHTSELQSHSDLVCRLLLEKKKHHIHQEETQ